MTKRNQDEIGSALDNCTDTANVVLRLKIGGVPEHFNYPFHMAIERGWFREANLDVTFQDIPEGTGAMLQRLKAEEVDVVVGLTEGIVSDILQGSRVRILATYVESPLCWAISTGANSTEYQYTEDLRDATWAVSRIGSGSHLMAYVLALQRGWDPRKFKFEVVGNFKNLRECVNSKKAAAFMWESFTSKPFHDSGEIKRIGDVTTPWPCFMLAATKEGVTKKRDEIMTMISVLKRACLAFHSEAGIPQQIATRYELKLEDAQAWYKGVRIVADRGVSEAALGRAIDALKSTGAVAPAPPNASITPTPVAGSTKTLKLDTTEEKHNNYDNNNNNNANANNNNNNNNDPNATGVKKERERQPSSLIDTRMATLLETIKSVQLYTHTQLVVYINDELRRIGKATGPLTYTDLLPYDQHHYYGSAGTDECARLIGCDKNPGMMVINVGSGLGGPARMLAGKYDCNMLAIELQDDLHVTAHELTQRCGLSGKVQNMCGNFLSIAKHLRTSQYDAVVSWLTFLHISDKVSLFRNCFDLLKEDGILFAEDFFERQQMTDEELDILKTDVFCSHVPSMHHYRADLLYAGFDNIQLIDCSEQWTVHTQQRADAFMANRERFLQSHPQSVFDGLSFFYNQIAKLFRGGNLGGVRVLATKPSPKPKPPTIWTNV